MEPKPFQKPHPPIWFGASHPDALRRAVRHGNGFFGAGSSTTKQFAEQVPIVRQALAEAGRDAASFKLGKRVYIAVEDDAQRARRRIGESLHRFYPFSELSGLEAVAVYGPPDACVRGLREVAQRARSSSSQPGLRRGRADGAPRGRGGAQALLMLLAETIRD
jgi:alkanesulfonate monooxygenase SsuD/methylene tetrahydromethanopterin reductase-like flavin-dependent oxidoreductase (luciferase family)